MATKTVFVVHHSGTEPVDTYTIGVFSTKKRAEKVKKLADKNNRYSVEHNYIEEFVMNTYEAD